MLTKHSLTISLSLLLCAAIALAAPDSQIVSDIVIKTDKTRNGTEAYDYIAACSSARKGAPFSPKTLAKDLETLIESGIFSDVKIYLEERDDGVCVIYDTIVAPRVKLPLTIEGNDYFSAGKIRETLDINDGMRITQAILDKACDNLRAEYRKAYYNNTAIAAELSETDEEGFVTIALKINEGQREKIAGFEFIGNSKLQSSELRAALGAPSPYNPFKIFYSQWRINALDKALIRDRIIEHYRNNGYLDVQVELPTLHKEADEDNPTMKIKISEGSQYTFSSVSISNTKIFSHSEISSLISKTLKPGTIVSDATINAVTKTIRDYYGARGYVDTEVTARIRNSESNVASDTKTATLRVEIKEGIPGYVRSITIRGNTHTKDKVIRRELLVAPGLLLNEVLAETSRRRVENLGYFENVRYSEIPAPGDPSQRDLIYDVTEKSTGTLMCGIGTSNIDSILGYIDISQNNFDLFNWSTFRGGGQKIRLTASAGSSSNSGEISWTDPWFLDKQQSFTVSLYRRENSYSEYDDTRIGGDLSLAVPLKYGRLSLKLGAEIVENDDFLEGLYHPEDNPTYDYYYEKEIDDKYLRIPLRLTWLYDTRNHPFVPTRGSRNNVFAEIQSTSLGSDYDIYKIGADLRQYLPSPIDGHYISLRLRAETVDGYGDTDEIPINDRLFLGGARSLRGYRHREVGPKVHPDAETGGRSHPVGGQTLAMFSAEYNIPLAKVLRLAAFYDIGNVWHDSFDPDFGELASTWGFGIRFDIPGFPIRLDYAIPLEHDDDYTRTERFIFSIGFE